LINRAENKTKNNLTKMEGQPKYTQHQRAIEEVKSAIAIDSLSSVTDFKDTVPENLLNIMECR
jgi:hypothetical protein